MDPVMAICTGGNLPVCAGRSTSGTTRARATNPCRDRSGGAESRHDRTRDQSFDFTGPAGTFLNCTLKRSPEPSHTQGLVDVSAAIMRKHGVEVELSGPSTTTSPPASTST